MELTPGLRFVGRWVVSTVLPFFAFFLILIRILAFVGISLSIGGAIALLVIIIPSLITLYILSTNLVRKRRAAALGARLMPEIQGRVPGNGDIMWDMMRRLETDYIGTAVLEQVNIHGPIFNLRFFWEDHILTTEPHHIKNILATDFNNYVKGEKFKETAKSVLGTGVFNSDGDIWKLHRSMTRPFFTIERISHFDIFDRHAETTLTLMKERFRAGLAIDFQDLIARFTLDSATEFLFAHCIDTLAERLPYPYNHSKHDDAPKESNTILDFAAAFIAAEHVLAKRNTVGATWPLFELWADPTKKPMEVVNAFLEPIIKDAIEKQKASQDIHEEKDSEDVSLLDHLVRQTNDIRILKDETLNILLAGRDSTSSTLTSAMYLMAMHPDVLRRLREEILEKVGPTRRPTYDDIREMKYLRAVLNEALRLFPPVPFNIRESVKDTTWQSSNPNEKPFFIPGGSMITYSVLLMHRRTDLWGPDALEFDPDRFIDDRSRKYLTPNPSIFLPFNTGPRICLGQQFAYNEMSFMMIRLLQNFSSVNLSLESQDPAFRPPAAWALGKGRQTIEKFYPRNHLTLYAKGGLWVKMDPAEM